MTAFDSSHFLPGVELLASIDTWAPYWQVRVWDLGLQESEHKYLRSRYKHVVLDEFPFDRYPDHFRMDKAAGSFAWKPEIVWAVAQEVRGKLIWMDGGNRLIGSVEALERIVDTYQFYSPYSAGTLAEWTYATTLDGLKVPEALRGEKNLNGALIAFDLESSRAKSLLSAWRECALDPNLLCPDGSNLSNHRQDQAILSCVAQLAKYSVPRCLCYVNSGLGVAIHTDDDISLEVKRDVGRWMAKL